MDLSTAGRDVLDLLGEGDYGLWAIAWASGVAAAAVSPSMWSLRPAVQWQSCAAGAVAGAVGDGAGAAVGGIGTVYVEAAGRYDVPTYYVP